MHDGGKGERRNESIHLTMQSYIMHWGQFRVCFEAMLFWASSTWHMTSRDLG